MRIAIVTDAWSPQVNGVVRTLETTKAELARMGHNVSVVSPDLFRSLPCPTYPEIRLAAARAGAIARRIEQAEPDAIHIATEGPLGLAARRWCVARALPFTTAYHTQFPQYLARRTHLPPSLFWRYIRWFHQPAEAVLVATPTLARELRAHGLARTRLWSRGVDLACFHPDGGAHPLLARLPRPIQLYAGRVAVEKNIEAFLRSDVAGSKVVVGDGPALARLKKAFPTSLFTGALFGEQLASAYRAADVFVFPSRSDTFGLVMIEALACGTPVAAFPVPGPADILSETVGAMRADLGEAIRSALARDRNACAAYGARFNWPASARQFQNALVPIVRRTAAA